MQRRGGISRYFVELIKAFQQNADLGINPVLMNSNAINDYAISNLKGLGVSDCSGVLQPWRELVLSLINPTNENGWDVVHHTFYQKNFLRKYHSYVQAVTLYDMIPEITNAKGRFGNPHFAKERYLKNCDLVFSISNSATDDAKRIYNLPKLQTHLTYLAPSSSFSFDLKPKRFRQFKFVLFVGNRNGYKQGALLIEAFSMLKEFSDLKLLFIGGGKFLPSELELISNLNLNGRVIQEEANDVELNELYIQAELYVMPSLYEGFGLPALEAMAAKCPVLLSDTSSLPEVGGKAAHYFRAGEKEELAKEMRKIITSPDMRHSMALGGLVQAKNFSWEKCAEETANGYRLALQAKGKKGDYPSNACA
ncbi:MAG: glycosyltransferase family 1 protein [Actinobacteria bacterium]|nr:glycosyltransferase family 1 protein [Actinomycetota bacterium]